MQNLGDVPVECNLVIMSAPVFSPSNCIDCGMLRTYRGRCSRHPRLDAEELIQANERTARGVDRLTTHEKHACLSTCPRVCSCADVKWTIWVFSFVRVISADSNSNTYSRSNATSLGSLVVIVVVVDKDVRVPKRPASHAPRGSQLPIRRLSLHPFRRFTLALAQALKSSVC